MDVCLGPLLGGWPDEGQTGPSQPPLNTGGTPELHELVASGLTAPGKQAGEPRSRRRKRLHRPMVHACIRPRRTAHQPPLLPCALEDNMATRECPVLNRQVLPTERCGRPGKPVQEFEIKLTPRRDDVSGHVPYLVPSIARRWKKLNKADGDEKSWPTMPGRRELSYRRRQRLAKIPRDPAGGHDYQPPPSDPDSSPATFTSPRFKNSPPASTE